LPKITLGWLRLRAVWLFVLAFLFFAKPTPLLLTIGAGLAVVGLAVRAWAAGSISKNHELSTGGPYAFTRNPLYLGSFFLGLGSTLAGGRWEFVAVFLAFFGLVYSKTMRREEAVLEELFGERFRLYAASVPRLVPRLVAAQVPGTNSGADFRLSQYRDNREWEALVGAVGAFGYLTVKMILAG
jgi:protein-S-isoprenylcysteine O-methyltransferase Ste14